MRQQDTLVFFAADPGYAFPMYAAATSFRQNSGCDGCDVTMFAVDFTAAQFDRLRALAAPWRISVEPTESVSFVPASQTGVRSAGAAKPWLGPTPRWADYFQRFEALRSNPDVAMFAPPHASSAWPQAPASVSLKAMTLDRARAAQARAGILAVERTAPF